MKKIISFVLLYMAALCTPVFADSNSVDDAHSYSLSCSEGDFLGEARFRWSITQGIYTLTLTRYRITKSNNNAGGNFANINLMTSNEMLNRATAYSVDGLIQDGAWHDANLSASVVWKKSPQMKDHVEFVFDQAGPDPRCKKEQWHAVW